MVDHEAIVERGGMMCGNLCVGESYGEYISSGNILDGCVRLFETLKYIPS